MIGRQITKIGRQIEKQVTEKKRGWEGGGEKRRNGERKRVRNQFAKHNHMHIGILIEKDLCQKMALTWGVMGGQMGEARDNEALVLTPRKIGLWCQI